MVMRGGTLMTLVWLLSLPACTPDTPATTPSGSESSATATGDDAGPECSAVGPYDAAGFTFRASCTYGLPSDGSALAACDQWSQGGVDDWGQFIEGCIQRNGTLSSEFCAAAGRVGECQYAPSCTNEVVTYFYGASGTPSFELACVAYVGATWTPM
jgi:hypothetical protein